MYEDLMDMDIDEMRDEIKKVMRYKSGEDSCNSVYVGSLATAGVVQRLGGIYGLDMNIDKLVDEASVNQIKRTHSYLYKGYIEYMRKNPVKNCPHCGQVMSAKEK